jgi:hypothetical protein
MFLTGTLALAFTGFAHAQARDQTIYSALPAQITAQYQYTNNNYYFRQTNGSLAQTNLNGMCAEVATRWFYPFEFLGKASYSKGPIVGQKFESFTAGAGYTRLIGRFQPFVRITAGMAETSSSDTQYLYTAPKFGITEVAGGGVDYGSRHWGIRLAEVDVQHLPYGSRSSVYTSAGAGIFYRPYKGHVATQTWPWNHSMMHDMVKP